MKISLFIFVILWTSFGFSRADHPKNSTRAEIEACTEKCSEEDRRKKFVCFANGLGGVGSRCYFNCMKSKYKWEESECKPGSSAYCWNSECPPEEKITKKGEWWCHKDYEKTEFQVHFGSVCSVKCEDGTYKKDTAYVSCK